MGILNVTPDSFAERVASIRSRAPPSTRALRMEADGADIIDVGGESTRPGAEPVAEARSWRACCRSSRRWPARLRVPISVDTYKADVARAALDAGAAIVNDVSGLRYEPALARRRRRRRGRRSC